MPLVSFLLIAKNSLNMINDKRKPEDGCWLLFSERVDLDLETIKKLVSFLSIFVNSCKGLDFLEQGGSDWFVGYHKRKFGVWGWDIKWLCCTFIVPMTAISFIWQFILFARIILPDKYLFIGRLFLIIFIFLVVHLCWVPMLFNWFLFLFGLFVRNFLNRDFVVNVWAFCF